MLRKKMSAKRATARNIFPGHALAAGPMREIDRRRVTTSDSGTAISMAMLMPAVAIASVSSVDLNIRRRNSGEVASG
jgi:hypothetical protein